MIDLDIPTRPQPLAPTLTGFYRTLGVPAFWDGARAVREALPGGSVRLVAVLRQAAAAGAPMEDVPEVREWQAYGR